MFNCWWYDVDAEIRDKISNTQNNNLFNLKERIVKKNTEKEKKEIHPTTFLFC